MLGTSTLREKSWETQMKRWKERERERERKKKGERRKEGRDCKERQQDMETQRYKQREVLGCCLEESVRANTRSLKITALSQSSTTTSRLIHPLSKPTGASGSQWVTVPLSHQFQVLVQQVGVPLWRLRASGKGHILRLGNPSALGFSWGTGRGASGSLWCLLENEIRNMQAERENPGPVSHPFSCCSLWGPFSLKSPQPFISSWAHSVSCSFSFSVFLVSASKKPLPPTPEDNRVSESTRSGLGEAGPRAPQAAALVSSCLGFPSAQVSQPWPHCDAAELNTLGFLGPACLLGGSR